MGKGFENYMSKKWFHPTNIDNMKRVYAAKLKESEFIKRQNDLKEQYEREQEVFGNKQLMGDEKARLGLSFLYNAPASLAEQEKKKQEKGTIDDEDSSTLTLGTSSKTEKIRNMRCLKCKKWGHANTDKVCPLYGKSKLDVDFEVDNDENEADSVKLQLAVKESEQTVASSSSQSDEISIDMLVSLSKKEKKAILKRLRKLLKKSKWRKKARIE